MPEISMCADPACPVRQQCRRHQASGTEPSGWQSWAGFQHEGPEGCASFWPVDAAATAPKRSRANCTRRGKCGYHA